jgi:hypothetical protein
MGNLKPPALSWGVGVAEGSTPLGGNSQDFDSNGETSCAKSPEHLAHCNVSHVRRHPCSCRDWAASESPCSTVATDGVKACLPSFCGKVGGR